MGPEYDRHKTYYDFCPEYDRHKTYYDFWMAVSCIPGLILAALGFPLGLLASWFCAGVQAGWQIQVVANTTVEKSQPQGGQNSGEAKL